jgi:ABC-type branched-subunit amino acid transport system ATPase component
MGRVSQLAETVVNQAAIAATGLRKSYGDKLELDGIDLNVPAGTIFALLGPNGAGKTTAVQILSTLISPDGRGSGRWRSQRYPETPSVPDLPEVSDGQAVEARRTGARRVGAS